MIARNNVRVFGVAARQPMVFAHGFGCDQGIWRHVAPAFETKYRVVLFDHVGSGASDLSAYDPAKYRSLGGYADDLLEICRALDLPPLVFVGHSVSAMIGVLAAIREPDRFAKLVLVGPSPRYIDDDDYRGGFSREDIDGLLESLDSNYLGWAATMAPVIIGNSDRPELGEELTETFCRLNPAVARQFARVTFLSDNRADLDAVTTPALVLQTSDDVIASRAVGEFVHRHLKGSSLVLMRATGHCPHLSAPAETIAAIEAFLAGSTAGAAGDGAGADGATGVAARQVVDESAEDLLENAPCGYFATSDDGTILRVNQTFLDWTGYRRDDLVGRMRIHDLLGSGDRIFYETRYVPLLRIQSAVREVAVDFVRADGGTLPALMNSVLAPASDDSPPLVRTTIFDATDRRRYEQELVRARRSAERLLAERDAERHRLRRVLAAMHDGIVTVDHHLRVQFANEAAHEIHGLGELEVGALLPDAWEGFSLRVFAGDLFSEGARERHVDHAPAPDASYSVIGIPPQASDEVVLVFTDLSEISRREQAEREFVANAAHELRTPLTAISMAIEVLQSGAKEIPADRDVFLADIEREAERLRRLTRALLLLAEIQAQKESPAVEAIDLRTLLDETALGLQVAEGVAVDVECERGTTAWTNPDLAAQALATVAENAAKYTVAGRISLRAVADDAGATIVVADTGPGIDREEQARLFERFYRGGERGGNGFGLGLPIARQAVESLGGTIEIGSSPGGGTAVVLRLPSAPKGRP